MAVAVLGIGVTALVTSLGVMSTTTIANRSNAQAEGALLSVLEYTKTLPLSSTATSPSLRTFTACFPTQLVITTEVPLPAGMVAYVGPGSAAPGAPSCGQLMKLPVRVIGDGYDFSVAVVRRP